MRLIIADLLEVNSLLVAEQYRMRLRSERPHQDRIVRVTWVLEDDAVQVLAGAAVGDHRSLSFAASASSQSLRASGSP
jgi:hypothetical protein